jgi:WD40 repeat protein
MMAVGHCKLRRRCSNTSLMAQPTIPPLELEHAIGFSAVRSGLHTIPNTTRYAHVVGGCVVISDVADEHFQLFLRGHDDDITALRVSRSGRFMLTGQRGHNADVCLWDTSSFRIVQRFCEIEKGVLAVDISHDDSLVAAVGLDMRLTFFDVSNGGLVTHAPLLHMMQPDETIRDASFGGKVEDAKRRETGSFHFCVCTGAHVWPFHVNPFDASLTPVKINLTPFQRRYSAVRYSDHGDLLFIGSDAGDIAVVSINNGNVVNTCRVCSNGVRELVVVPSRDRGTQDPAAFKYARFGPGSERTTTLYIGGGDGIVACASVRDHSDPALEVSCKRTVGEAVCGLAIIDANQGTVLVGTAKGTTFKATCDPQVKSMTTGVERWADAVDAAHELIVAHPSRPDVCVTAGRDGIVRQWDLNSYRVTGQFQQDGKDSHAAKCSGICVSDGLEIQLSAWSDGCVRCHDMTNFQLLWTHARAHRSAVTAIAVSQSMKFFVTGSSEGDIKIWDMRTRELKGELKDHLQAIVKLEIFDDDRHVISASKDRTVVTWDIVNCRRLTSHEAHSGPLTSMLLCRNQCNVYTSGADKKINYWDLRQKEPVRTTNYAQDLASEAYCTRISRSGDERLLATGGTDQIVRLWDERSMAVLATGLGHSGTVTDCVFTSDNKQVLSCGTDSAFMVWNVYA